MTTIKQNLRKVATIVACLAVVTVFATCNKTNGDPDNGGGTKINSPIVSHYWEDFTTLALGGRYTYLNYIFYPDGTFLYSIRSSNDHNATVEKGNYTINGNKISLTNKKRTNLVYSYTGVNTPYKEITAIIGAAKNASFSTASPSSQELIFTLSNDGQVYNEYETGDLLTITTNGADSKFRKVKKQ
jgi:hypothetical protein